MFTGYQVLMLLLEFLVTIVAVWGVVTRSQSALKIQLQSSIDDVKVAHHETLGESRDHFTSINKSFETIGLQINTILEGHVRELQARVTRLESGQDEWTKELRERTHDLAGKVERVIWEIDALKKERKESA